jgi:outer membrane receptor protein involved in Fe transport
MNRTLSRPPAVTPALALCLILAAPLAAQTAAPEPANDPDTLVLSPFTVSAEEDDGYLAKSTLAGTRVRTELKDVGSATSIVTAQFLQDTNSKNSDDLLVYTTGTEVASQGGNFAGGGDGPFIASNYNSPVSGTRVRGLAAADNLRDFFLTDIPWDSYNTGRVDLQRGANSILFGIGSPAGIINNSLNEATFRDANNVEFQFTDLGTFRGTIDLNKELVDNQLSIRLAGLYDDTKYRQKPAYRDDHRLYGALRYEPAFFRRNGARTVLRANYENGKVDGRQPANTPPIDAITPWFTAMNQAVYPWLNDKDLISPANQKANPWVGTAGLNNVFDGMIAQFADPNGGNQSHLFPADVFNYPNTSDTSRNNTVNGRYLGIVAFDQYAKNAGIPGATVGAFKPKSLTDASIFDFYNNLLAGPNKRNWSEWDAYNLNLAQTFYDNKLGFELAYDRQDMRWGYRNMLRDGYNAITVDIISTYMDGTPNPNVGRAMVIGLGSAYSGWSERDREAIRGTAFGELNFKDVLGASNIWGKILGRHNLTWSGMQQSAKTTTTTWSNYFLDEAYGPSASASLGTGTRDVITFSYLSPDLRGSSGPSGLHLSRIGAYQLPASGAVTQWNTDSKSFQSYNAPLVDPNSSAYNDDNRPYTNATRHKDVIDSQVFVWQGYFLGGHLVPTIGWRKDTATAYDAGPPPKAKGVVTNFNDGTWRLPETQADATSGRIFSTVTGQTHTFSIVGHLPRKWLAKVPGRLGLSAFYNRSENFQPDASRIDVTGDPIGSPTGRTKDYGVTITALDDRIMFKVNRYQTSVYDTTLATEMGGGWAIGYVEAWGQMFAKNPGSTVYGVTSAASKFGAGNVLKWQPPDAGNHVIPGDNSSPYTQEAIDAQYDIQRAAENDWFAAENQIPDKMKAAWGMSDYATGGGSISNPLVRLTGDTVSEGTEFELIATPLKGWDISINASKTDARRTAIAKSFEDWIAKRTADFAGPMGDIRFWGAGNWVLAEGSNATVRDFWKNTLLTGYNLSKALNNSSVPELRPWRFNVVTNYAFQEGALKGFTVGGGYRWQDKQVTGYPFNSAKTGYDVTAPFYGATEDAFDFWASYSHRLGKRVNWRIQLNVRDAFASKDLIPITVQPDGSPAAYRIPPPRVISLSNRFEF